MTRPSTSYGSRPKTIYDGATRHSIVAGYFKIAAEALFRKRAMSTVVLQNKLFSKSSAAFDEAKEAFGPEPSWHKVPFESSARAKGVPFTN